MSTHAMRVLVGYDGSKLAELAVRHAFEQAAHRPTSEVHVVHVVPPSSELYLSGSSFAMWGVLDVAPPAMPPAVETSREGEVSSEHRELERQVLALYQDWSKGEGAAIDKLAVHSRANLPASGILTLAEDLDVNLIVMGTHGRKGLRRFIDGSVAETVLRDAHCPVLVVRLEEEQDVPEIEPPCPKCVEVRFETEGKEQWCERHREHHTFGRPLRTKSRGADRPAPGHML